MLIVVSLFLPIIAIELAIIIWLLIHILHNLEEIEHHEKPPLGTPQPQPHRFF
ncbi:hypothetical protein Sgly_1564 [Syntrophobotulus glycolicus DSM 8271]|uniref:Uncharacterized protein n=1 Tax=Syntrophobotulus glycolicus (strain DSM 8271 / FlGlyR) TaxID=645991 RepID=F0SXN1_SYNGF|nr:hypothetical protein [Syntrophobotulus glycolicus]ADY55864.1 hypothetical protein Sgly_1564 [Syntrophobotulus glycolicus DSM 8271]